MNEVAEVRRFRVTRSGLAATGLAFALHGIWWYLAASPDGPAHAPVPVLPVASLVYVPDPASMEDARALGSPVLFALPTGLGFSGEARAESRAAPSGLRGAESWPVLMDPASVPQGTDDFLPPLDQVVVRTPSSFSALPEVSRTFNLPTGSTGFVLRIYWPDGTPSLRGGLPGAGVLAPVLKDRPWELGALLEFDDQGTVRHVFLEKPTPDRDRNEVVARALRALRVDSGGQESRVRVVVQYEQDVAGRTLSAGARRP